MKERESISTTRVSAPTMAICVAAWLIPGLGHFMLRRQWRGLLFMVIVTTMFVLGIHMDGELFRLEPPQRWRALADGRLGDFGSRPLTFLAGLAEMGVGLLYFLARLLQFGAGDVKSITYEYGYTFCIGAGSV